MSKSAIWSPKSQTKFPQSHGMDRTVNGILICPTQRYTHKSQCPVASYSPMGWDRTLGCGVYLRMGYVRIPGTVTSIPWDCGTGLWDLGDTSAWEWDVWESYRQPVHPMGLWDGMGHWVLGFKWEDAWRFLGQSYLSCSRTVQSWRILYNPMGRKGFTGLVGSLMANLDMTGEPEHLVNTIRCLGLIKLMQQLN